MTFLVCHMNVKFLDCLNSAHTTSYYTFADLFPLKIAKKLPEINAANANKSKMSIIKYKLISNKVRFDGLPLDRVQNTICMTSHMTRFSLIKMYSSVQCFFLIALVYDILLASRMIQLSCARHFSYQNNFSGFRFL